MRILGRIWLSFFFVFRRLHNNLVFKLLRRLSPSLHCLVCHYSIFFTSEGWRHSMVIDVSSCTLTVSHLVSETTVGFRSIHPFPDKTDVQLYIARTIVEENNKINPFTQSSEFTADQTRSNNESFRTKLMLFLLASDREAVFSLSPSLFRNNLQSIWWDVLDRA